MVRPLTREIVQQFWPDAHVLNWNDRNQSAAENFFGLMSGTVSVLTKDLGGDGSLPALIAGALRVAGLNAVGSFNPLLPENQVVIYVGQHQVLPAIKQPINSNRR
jgi:hypothetical protein